MARERTAIVVCELQFGCVVGGCEKGAWAGRKTILKPPTSALAGKVAHPSNSGREDWKEWVWVPVVHVQPTCCFGCLALDATCNTRVWQQSSGKA